MQYLMSHTFLPPCLTGLRQFFPDLDTELAYFGITPEPMRLRQKFSGAAIPEPYAETDVNAPQTLPITRGAYETLLRRLIVKGKPNVRFATGTVTSFQKAGDRLDGVRFRTADRETVIKGNFVIDATGPAQLSFNKWLKNAGFPVPSSIKVKYDSPVVYSQSIWTIPAHLQATLDTIVPSGFNPGLMYAHGADVALGERDTFGILLAEDSQLIIMSLYLAGSGQIRSAGELRSFVGTLTTPAPHWVSTVITLLEANEAACAPQYSHGNSTECNYIKYHELAGRDLLPRNWVAMGDATMKLNHHYGLGVGKAMIEAVTLDGVLRATSTDGFASSNISDQFFQKAVLRTRKLWETTKASDYGIEETTPVAGETHEDGKFSRAFGRELLSTASKDPAVYATWWNVNMLLAPETDLLSVVILAKVARNWLMG